MTTTARPAPLVPIAERSIPFHGDAIAAALVPGADGEPVIMVPVRPLCDRLGLAWPPQYARIQRDPVLARAAVTVTVTVTDGSRRAVVCLPAEMLHGWLFGVSAQRVRPEYREALNTYRAECFAVLWRAYQAGDLGAPGPRPEIPAASAGATLAQVRATALAVAALAEQQMAHEARLTTTEERLDRAALVVADLGRRVGAIETGARPAPITEAQAAEVSQAVKALAALLTERGQAGGQNAYQAVFGELYRRFGVSSYKNLPAARFADALAFLDDWRAAALAGRATP